MMMLSRAIKSLKQILDERGDMPLMINLANEGMTSAEGVQCLEISKKLKDSNISTVQMVIATVSDFQLIEDGDIGLK